MAKPLDQIPFDFTEVSNSPLKQEESISVTPQKYVPPAPPEQDKIKQEPKPVIFEKGEGDH